MRMSASAVKRFLIWTSKSVSLSLSLSLSALFFSFRLVAWLFILIEKYFSIAIHPNKLVVATGQVCGTDRRDAMVRTYYIRFYQGWTKSNTLKTMIDDTDVWHAYDMFGRRDKIAARYRVIVVEGNRFKIYLLPPLGVVVTSKVYCFSFDPRTYHARARNILRIFLSLT